MWDHLPPVIVYSRHPQCEHNIDHESALARGIKNRHSPLTKAGEIQRDVTAAYLKKEFPSIDGVFCSTYHRTRTLPEAAGLANLMVEDNRLDERNMGVWHVHGSNEVLKRYPGEDSRLKEMGYYHYLAPDGETCVHVEDRHMGFLSDKQVFSDRKVMYISGHGISGLCLRKVLTGGSLEDWLAYERLANASVSVYQKFGDRYICALWNHIPWAGQIDPELLKKISHEV